MFDALIRTYNSSRTLEDAVKALRQQSVPPAGIVVVDSGSTDGTREIALRIGCTLVRYPEEPFNYSKALNLGLDSARSPALLVLSSHVLLLDRDITARLLSEIANPQTPAAYVNYLAEDSYRETVNRTNFNGWNGLWNPCAMYRTEVARRIRFAEHVPAAEDQFFATQLYASGMSTVAIGSSHVRYGNPNANARKLRNDYVAIAYFVHRPLLSGPNVMRVMGYAARHAVALRWHAAIDRALLSMRLVAARFRQPRFQSAYFRRTSPTRQAPPGPGA